MSDLDAKPQASLGRRLMLSVYAPTFLLSLSEAVLIPILPLYAQGFGVSLSLVSLAVGVTWIGTLLTDLPAGLLLQRMGRRRMTLFGTGAIVLSMLAVGLLDQFAVLVAARALAGVGTAMWGIARLAYLSDVTTPGDRGRAMSLFGGINRIGAFIGPVAGGIIATMFSIRTPFFLSAALACFSLVIAYLFMSESGRTRTDRAVQWQAMGTVVRRHWRDLAAAGSAQVFVQMIRVGRGLLVPLYGANVLGLDIAAVGSIVSISAAIDMSLFLPAGLLMDRLGRKFASVPSFLIMGVGMALIPLAGDFTGLLLATAVIGLGNGLGSGAMMTLGADLAPREAVGEFLGVWRLIGDAGGAGGPLIVGIIADAVGLALSAIALAGIGFVAAATLALFVRETLHPPAAAVAASQPPP